MIQVSRGLLLSRRSAIGRKTNLGPDDELTDSFDRADTTNAIGTADSGHVYTQRRGAWGISSNKAYESSNNSTAVHGGVVTADVGYSSQTISCDITATLSMGKHVGCILRYVDLDNYWFAMLYRAVSDGHIYIYMGKVVAGVETYMITEYDVGFSGAVYSLEFSVDENGRFVTTVNGAVYGIVIDDTTHASATEVGLFSFEASGARFENLNVVETMDTAPVIADSFNRANDAGSLGSADTGELWTPRKGTWGISANKGYNPTGGEWDVVSVDDVTPDRIVKVVLPDNTFGGSDKGAGLVARLSDLNNFWFFFIYRGGGTDCLPCAGKFVAGVANYSILNAPNMGTPTAPVTIELRCMGNRISAYIDGVKWGPTVEDTFNNTQTRVGLMGYRPTTPQWEDFLVM